MPIVGKTDLKADKDVNAGAQISLADLFPYPERSKEFTLDTNVKGSQTRLKITVPKLGTLITTTDATQKKGEKTNLFRLMNANDFFTITIKASEVIKKGDVLTVNIETV